VLPIQPIGGGARIGDAELNWEDVSERELSEEELDTVSGGWSLLL
jgi:bacteriocin-like protein